MSAYKLHKTCQRNVWGTVHLHLFAKAALCSPPVNVKKQSVYGSSYKDYSIQILMVIVVCGDGTSVTQPKLNHQKSADFTPFCASTDGMLGVETDFFIKHPTDYFAMKWECPFSVIKGWIRTMLSLVILQATILCIHSLSIKWKCLGIVDGTSLSLTITN